MFLYDISGKEKRVMRTSFIACLFVLLLIFAIPSHAQNQIAGYWKGVGNLPNDEVKLTVKFKVGNGGIQGTIDIPDSGFIFGSPLSNISVNNSKVHFEVPREGNVPFDGEIQGETISGTFQFNKVSFPFVLKRTALPPALYREEEVHLQNGNTKLSGTLLIPVTNGKHPAIVFHHGAYQDTREAWRFFADHFARRGIATLIYDNRGSGESTGYPRAGFDDLAGDVLAAVQLLKERKDVDPKQIGLWAGSQAGWISPLAAARSKDVAFIMLMSGPGVTVARNVLYESESNLRAAGFSEGDIKRALAVKQSILDTARTESWEKAEPIFQKAKNEKWFPYIGVPGKDNWFRWWWVLVGNYDPAPLWEKTTIPVLNIDGELDKNVPVEESFTRMESALKKAGNKDFTLKVFPKADHSILVPSGSGRPVLAPGFLDFITDWLLKRVSVKN